MLEEKADMVIGSRFSGEASAMAIRRYIGDKLFPYTLRWRFERRFFFEGNAARLDHTFLPCRTFVA